ncbi:MAG: tetratricopeptide repeat protein [Colwellia sp.]
MSVINQMLKDLDKRNPEPNKSMVQFNHAELGYSARKIVLVTSVIVLILCFVSFYIWQLMSENKALRAAQFTNQVTQPLSQLSTQQRSNGTDNDSATTSPQKNTLTQAGVNKKTLQRSITAIAAPLQAKNNRGKQEVSMPLEAEVIEPVDSVKTVSSHLPLSTVPLSHRPSSKPALKSTHPITPTVLATNRSTHVTPAIKRAFITDTDTDSVAPMNKAKAGKMSVSRHQLSANDLAEKKLALAEKAIEARQIEKAEKLLEEVVILKPSDSQTRKKLAALWFGRKAYRDAISLLSQGIALDSQDSSLRKMKARIHLQQGQVTAALKTLKPLDQLKDEQYQVMLANTAQQAQQNKVAVKAYQLLTTMQPDVGRWLLGLAVLYDKNSQFNLASVAYNQALTKNDLSISSENFIKQRIQVIGQ